MTHAEFDSAVSAQFAQMAFHLQLGGYLFMGGVMLWIFMPLATLIARLREEKRKRHEAESK